MYLKTKFLTLALAGSHLMFGSLIYVGQVDQVGTGLGAVNTLLTITSPGNSSTETGCVGWNGTTTVTTSAICPTGFSGGDNLAINNTYTRSSLGLNNFDSIQLIFNASEPAGNSITVDNLALTLYSSTGSLLASYTLAAPVAFASTATGTGKAGFGFQLDAAQASLANGFLNVAGLRIGGALNASDATGGLETVFIRSINNGGVIPPNETTIPEPATYAGVGVALIGLVLLRRKLAAA